MGEFRETLQDFLVVMLLQCCPSLSGCFVHFGFLVGYAKLNCGGRVEYLRDSEPSGATKYRVSRDGAAIGQVNRTLVKSGDICSVDFNVSCDCGPKVV